MVCASEHHILTSETLLRSLVFKKPGKTCNCVNLLFSRPEFTNQGGWDGEKSKHTCRQTIGNLHTVIVMFYRDVNNRVYYVSCKRHVLNMINKNKTQHQNTCAQCKHTSFFFLPSLWQASARRPICCWNRPSVDTTCMTQLLPCTKKRPSCCWRYPASPCCSSWAFPRLH